jgi:hypothetical protein
MSFLGWGFCFAKPQGMETADILSAIHVIFGLGFSLRANSKKWLQPTSCRPKAVASPGITGTTRLLRLKDRIYDVRNLPRRRTKAHQGRDRKRIYIPSCSGEP